MIYITAVRQVGGTDHEHIAEVRWHDPDTGQAGESTQQAMVEWIDKRGGDVRVRDTVGDVQVCVAHVDPPHLGTCIDGRLTDNLLALPRY